MQKSTAGLKRTKSLNDNDTVKPGLLRRLGLFDMTMIVMGGIIGSGIFMNPYVVAREVHTPFLILSAWVFGGMIAMAGGLIYAELASRRPLVGGQYAYLRDAIHPVAAFLYGWSLLLVIQTGGMAAVALTFARYYLELTNWSLPDWSVAVAALAGLTVINCLGVKAGSAVQNVLMILKIGAILILIVAGLTATHPANAQSDRMLDQALSFDLVVAMGAAMIPVLFAYGGWQTSGFVAGEIIDAKRTLPRSLIYGVLCVVILYTAVNYVCVRTLGAEGLAQTTTPASAVMRKLLGEGGARLIAAGIAISTLGFLSQGMLTAPRVYYAMAQDRVFFRTFGSVDSRTHVPVAAIALQGLLASVIAVSGKYEQILNYVVSVDFIFFGLTAVCIFVFRRSDTGKADVTVPGHPYTTILFIGISWLIVINTIYKYPTNSVIGLVLIVAGIPAYLLWRRDKK